MLLLPICHAVRSSSCCFLVDFALCPRKQARPAPLFWAGVADVHSNEWANAMVLRCSRSRGCGGAGYFWFYCLESWNYCDIEAYRTIYIYIYIYSLVLCLNAGIGGDALI